MEPEAKGRCSGNVRSGAVKMAPHHIFLVAEVYDLAKQCNRLIEIEIPGQVDGECLIIFPKASQEARTQTDPT